MTKRKKKQSELRDVIDGLKADFNQVNQSMWKSTVEDVRDFYLSREQRKKFESKGKIMRWFYLAWCVFKAMLAKLSPGRSVALFVGLVLLFRIGFYSPRDELSILGGLIILVVLMLELKDKLVATDELREGRAIQHALMPDPEPAIPGYTVMITTEPANDVGGDLVDVQPLGSGRYGLALGDLAGKGLGAALMMARLHSTIRALAPDQPELSELAGRINHILCRDGVKTRFASLVYLVVEEASGTVRYFNAGHMPPVLVTAKGAVEQKRGGIAMGLKTGVRYREKNVKLGTGDVLIVYSDGLTEAQDGDGRFFGEERAMNLFAGLHGCSAREAMGRIRRELDAFRGAARLSDDLSLLIVTRTGK